MQSILQKLDILFNIGVSPNLSLSERTRIQGINRLCFAAGTVALFMIPLLQDSLPATIGVIAYAVCLYAVFLFHYLGWYVVFNVFLTVSLAIINVLFASGFDQRMGLEVHFIVTFVAVLHHFNEHKLRIFDAILTAFSFLLAMYMQFHHIYFFPAPRLTPYLFLVNNFFGLCFLAFIIVRFRTVLQNSQYEIEHKNRELEQQRQALEDANQIKDKLFSILGHDLRAPLNSINSFLSLLDADYLTPEERKEYVKKLQKAVLGSSQTLDNLVVWYMQQKNHTLQKEDVSLKQAAEMVKNTLGMLAEQKNIELLTEIPDTLTVQALPNFLPFMLRNLVANAIKFTPKGGQVKVFIAHQSAAEIWIAVKDNGLGISQENLLKIFQNKDNFSTLGTEKEKGSGLGLSFCKEFSAQNNSRFWAEATEGKGSTFYFSLTPAS